MMIAYPISISADGGLSVSVDPEVDHVRALIDTLYFERCMFPNYGTMLAEFDPVSSQSLGLMMMVLRYEISLWHDFDFEVYTDSENLEDGLIGLKVNIEGREVSLGGVS